MTNSVMLAAAVNLTRPTTQRLDPSVIAQVADLTITKTHTVNFRQGGTGLYTITVSNAGPGPTLDE